MTEQENVGAAVNLEAATTDDLIKELRSRGLVVSAWNIEDVRPILGDDEEFAERLEDMSGEEVNDLCEAVLLHPDNKLEDILAERGNTHLADFWSMYGKDVVSEWDAERAAPKA